MKSLVRFISLARGDQPVDLLLKNSRLINVLSGEIYREDIALAQGRIIGFGDYPAKQVINLKGLYLAPGFIDGHIHLESSLVSPAEFARTTLSHGTTSIVCDPHEITNVLGLAGLKYILDSNRYTPLTIYVMLPSCVPATNMETSGARIEAVHLAKWLRHKYIIGLAEVMNYPGVLSQDKRVLKKIVLCQEKVIDGHVPGVTGKSLYAYINAGIKSDHESVSLDEARRKLRAGMYLMIREGTAAKNLATILPVVNQFNARRCFLVSDDRHPLDLLREGHLDFTVKKAISLGLEPVRAIQMVTINPAEYFGLRNLGAIAPGYQADLVAFNNLSRRGFAIKMVIKAGKIVVRDGNLIENQIRPDRRPYQNSINLPEKSFPSLLIKAQARQTRATPDIRRDTQSSIKVIQIVPDQIITRKILAPAKIVNGFVVSDIHRDILKIAVIERYTGKGRCGLGFVKGFGLKRGALGSSVAHDSHNIILVGTNDPDMLKALRSIRDAGGGQVVVADNRILAGLALPRAGIISDQPIRTVAKKVACLNHAAHQSGCLLKDPFMTLSFLALAPIPELKITDYGLIDVTQFKIVPLFYAE